MRGDETTPKRTSINEQKNSTLSPLRRWLEAFGVLLLCGFVFYLTAVLPLQLILRNPPDPDETWGTESEAVAAAEHIINERLGRSQGRRIDWTPTATMEHPAPHLDQGCRIWQVSGEVAVDTEHSRRFRITVSKTRYEWVRIRIEENGRQVFFDDSALRLPPYEYFDDGFSGSFR